MPKHTRQGASSPFSVLLEVFFGLRSHNREPNPTSPSARYCEYKIKISQLICYLHCFQLQQMLIFSIDIFLDGNFLVAFNRFLVEEIFLNSKNNK